MKVSPTYVSGPGAPGWPAVCWVRAAHPWLQSLNVLIVWVQSLSVNVLPVSLLSRAECSVSQKYEYWHRVRWRGEKALQTHWASASAARLLQRGLIVIRPGDSGPHRHVVLFKLHHFISAYFFLNDKFEIKMHVTASFCYSSFYCTLLVWGNACTCMRLWILFSRPEKLIICACQN